MAVDNAISTVKKQLQQQVGPYEPDSADLTTSKP